MKRIAHKIIYTVALCFAPLAADTWSLTMMFIPMAEVPAFVSAEMASVIARVEMITVDYETRKRQEIKDKNDLLSDINILEKEILVELHRLKFNHGLINRIESVPSSAGPIVASAPKSDKNDIPDPENESDTSGSQNTGGSGSSQGSSDTFTCMCAADLSQAFQDFNSHIIDDHLEPIKSALEDLNDGVKKNTDVLEDQKPLIEKSNRAWKEKVVMAKRYLANLKKLKAQAASRNTKAN